MNFKFLFPSFRNRYVFVQKRLQRLAEAAAPDNPAFANALNLGTGEGDYDRMVAAYSGTLTGCDVNEEDLVHARQLNADVTNLQYRADNALALSYPDNSLDLIVSCEVIEHVGQPEKMVQEMARTLRPGGYVVMTFPSREFPITYDPVNRIWQWIKKPSDREFLISQGAYAFGHDYLIGSADFKGWAKKAGLEIVEFQGLTHHFTGLLEMYWTGIAQGIFKKNARNVNTDSKGSIKIRPASTGEPLLVFITDFLIGLDRILFSWMGRSVGKGVVLRKV